MMNISRGNRSLLKSSDPAVSAFLSIMATDMDQRMAPINARVENLSSFHLDNDLTYSTYTTSPKNSIIEFRLITGKTAFGRIAQIFKHRRVTHKKTVCFDTWFVIHSFPDAQPKSKNPFAKLYKYPFKVALCSYAPQTPLLIHTSEVISHCAWICYSAEEISSDLNQEMIALVSLSRPPARPAEAIHCPRALALTPYLDCTDQLEKIAHVNRRVKFLQSVHVEPNLTVETCFGRINQIFKHKRVILEKQTLTNVWLVVCSQFAHIPPNIPHPFTSLVTYNLQMDLSAITISFNTTTDSGPTMNFNGYVLPGSFELHSFLGNGLCANVY
ncbi:hypothetical protein PSTT_14643 [Puccinia striiformis]|uniref:Uncharacterized protein n=1 Tax=Puccinia striiformis TaxID=27350 RepID=A0A2S4ULH4_9BASI|nr:hypothetical protein PSTT_14643 [Puccinia striiformis]